ncbi:ATP-binding protein [Kitasatospora sp. LaBMicrA B282]|uniref:ATP-binding protein n=1 Tax=Kitasatospora sp. LaBMicrA B282 TaxID=3420949 RepID=UPI003D14526F
MSVGERIRQLRTGRGWSLSRLAELLHYSKSYLSRIENGTRAVSPEFAELCDRVLGADGELVRLAAGAAEPLRSTEPPRRSAAPARSESADLTAVDPPGRERAFRARPVPAQLPATGEMWGRERELARIEALVARQSGPAVVAVDGMGGAGKTTFAVWLARRLSPSYPGGLLFADLCTNSPAVPGDVATGLLRTLGVAPEDLAGEPAERAALLRSLLAERRVVVVLDDADSAAQVAPLLPGTGRSLVLVTSRRRLTALSVRHGALRVTLEPLAADAALHLLRRALDRRAEFGGPGSRDDVPAADRSATTTAGAATGTVLDSLLAEVARRCAYLPLALRIAAERLTEEGPAFAASLTTPPTRVPGPASSRLDALAVPGDAETAVRSVFAWSYRALSGELARAFRLLALHPGAVAGVGAVAALWGVPPEAAARLLGELHAASLVVEVAPGRYRMHDLLREYARERARSEEPETLATCADRVLAWYLHAAEAATDQLLGPARHRLPIGPLPEGCRPPRFAATADALAWCESERVNLLACVRAARDDGSPVAWQLPYVLWGFLFLRHHHHDQLAAGQLAAEGAAGHGPQAAACAELVLACAHAGLRQHPVADRHYRRGIECFGDGGDAAGEAGVRLGYAMSCMRQGRGAEAAEQVERAMALFAAAGSDWGTALALSTLGEARLALGRPGEALGPLVRARELHRAGGSLWLEAAAWTLSGSAHRGLGEHARAEDCYRRALELHGRTGMRAGAAHALHQLGLCLSVDGRARQARRAWLRSWALYDELGDPREADLRACLAGLAPCRTAAPAPGRRGTSSPRP